MSNQIFYTIGIGFASGIFFRSFFDLGRTGVLHILLLAIACALAWRMRNARFNSALLVSSVFLLTFGLGMFRMDIAENHFSALFPYEGTEARLEGNIVREPEYRTNSVHLYVELDEFEELILVTTDRFTDVSYGERVIIEGKVTVPESFDTDLGRSFNYPGYLKARGVRHLVSFAQVEVIAQGGNQIKRSLFDFKHAFMSAFEGVVPEPMAGLGEGVLLGVKRALGEDLEGVFRTTGIIHIVVLSGYNVMILVDWVMRFLALWFHPRTRLLIGVVVIVLFAILVGFSATVVRASIMAALLLIARTTGRTYMITRALLLAGIGMLLHNPYVLAFDPGFALSFLATLGLIIVAPLIGERLSPAFKKFKIEEVVTATLATQFFVLPFLLYATGTFSVVSIIVNVLVLPMVSVAMLLSFLTGVANLALPLLGTIVGFFAYLVLGYIITVAELFAKLPFAAFSVPAFPFWIVVVSYVLMGGVLFYLHKRGTKGKEEKVKKLINDYEGWVIEEEKEISSRMDIVGGNTQKPFPFR